MHDVVYDLGGLYFLLSGAMSLTAYVVSTSRGQAFDADDLLHSLGIAGLIVWFFALFGFVAWLVSLPFAEGFAVLEWIERVSGHPALIFPLCVVIVLATVTFAGSRRRSATPRSETA